MKPVPIKRISLKTVVNRFRLGRLIIRRYKWLDSIVVARGEHYETLGEAIDSGEKRIFIERGIYKEKGK